jgi:glyoxylase-like metal-dependent hydrolase (beta-lactamase superfamily II)
VIVGMYAMKVKHDPYLGIYVDSYILMESDACVFIDSGLYGQCDMIEDCVRDCETYVLCTHGHWDHIGMHKTLQELDADILASIGDKPYFEDHEWHWRMLFGQFEQDFDLPAARRKIYWAHIGSPVIPQYELEDGKKLKIGSMDFSVIAIPGHSMGSVCFLERNSGALFTGDGLIGNGFFGGTPQYMNVKHYLASMEKLMKIQCETVYSAHNPPMPGHQLADKAREGRDCCLRIDGVVRAYVRAHEDDHDLSLGDMIQAVKVKEECSVGGGTCITVLAHLENIEDPPICVVNCLARYMHGI